MADALRSGRSVLTDVWVQIPPSAPTNRRSQRQPSRACSSEDRALPCGGRGREFESRQAHHFFVIFSVACSFSPVIFDGDRFPPHPNPLPQGEGIFFLGAPGCLPSPSGRGDFLFGARRTAFPSPKEEGILLWKAPATGDPGPRASGASGHAGWRCRCRICCPRNLCRPGGRLQRWRPRASSSPSRL